MRAADDDAQRDQGRVRRCPVFDGGQKKLGLFELMDVDKYAVSIGGRKTDIMARGAGLSILWKQLTIYGSRKRDNSSLTQTPCKYSGSNP
jgi:hypothetical protein